MDTGDELREVRDRPGDDGKRPKIRDELLASEVGWVLSAWIRTHSSAHAATLKYVPQCRG
jgi:hypothetical protein